MIDFCEYTPVPFWFWNGNLDKSELERQILKFKDKGIDGFIIHPRLGLDEKIGYLTDRYFDFVDFAVRSAHKKNMIVYLYDEAMYPSGSCHGEVVRENPDFASKALKRTHFPKKGDKIIAKTRENGVSCYYTLMFSGGTIRGVFDNEDDREKNAPKSTDLLNGNAVDCFIRKTHEEYYRRFGEFFGTTIKGFFTDEPCVLGRNHEKNIIAWTDDFLDDYLSEGGNADFLYALFDKKYNSEKEIQAQKCYEKAIYNRLSKSYYSKLSDWCEDHGISLIGHPEKSTDIGYLKHFQIPCQDLVWRYVKPDRDGYISEKIKTYVIGEHSTMAKCSSDSARHRGKKRNGNEIFGCMGHIDDPNLITTDDIIWFLNYLFVRGVNFIIPHAFYYSTQNKKVDRPPDLGVHSPIWSEMGRISGYIKRMSYILTDCVNRAQVAILCSFDSLSDTAAKPFFENQVEFNYLETELLEECAVENSVLKIQNQEYRCLIRTEVYNERTEELLNQFQSQGIVIIDACEPDFFDKTIKNISRDCLTDRRFENLRYTHIVKDSRDIFIFTNEGEENIRTDIVFPTIKYNTATIFDPFNLTTEKQTAERIKLSLKPNDCKVIYFQM